ncbi:hypothetical protein [Bradyrhizobium cenepequi]|uniref:hypothetical protein n=1 Tax=Bradyrhizobium cenepequi TaxID=2821403 RepID=UPI001CE3921D|nr:hypothetical protein [Bradyrhizobium cenepequi]MCA6107961.1 hypothetical protein [Bradyrhizobium cenepequi]
MPVGFKTAAAVCRVQMLESLVSCSNRANAAGMKVAIEVAATLSNAFEPASGCIMTGSPPHKKQKLSRSEEIEQPGWSAAEQSMEQIPETSSAVNAASSSIFIAPAPNVWETAAGSVVTRRPHAGGYLEAKCAEDDELISKFRTISNLAVRPLTVRQYAASLRRFSDWLHDSKKEPIARRLHGDGLTLDANAFKVVDNMIQAALTMLRESVREQTGRPAEGSSRQIARASPAKAASSSTFGAPTPNVGEGAAERAVTPRAHGSRYLEAKYAEDEDLIFKFRTTLNLNLQPVTIQIYSTALRKFSDWLHDSENKRPIADRLYDDQLMEDAKAFRDVYKDHQTIITALTKLRDFWCEQGGTTARVGAPHPGTRQEQPADEPEFPSSTPPDVARPSSASWAAELSQGFAAPWSVPELGHSVGLGWSHGRQSAPESLISALNRSGVRLKQFQSTDVYIRGRPYRAQMEPGRAERTPNNPLGDKIVLSPQLGSAGERLQAFPPSAGEASSSARVREPSSAPGGSATYRELNDFRAAVGPNWIHGDQEAPRRLLMELRNWDQLPNPFRRSIDLFIYGERYTAEFRTRERDPNRILGSQQSGFVYLIHQPRPR